MHQPSRSLLMVALVALLAADISCRRGGGADRPSDGTSSSGGGTEVGTPPPPPPPPPPATTQDRFYDNGHSLSTATTNSYILEMEAEVHQLIVDYRVARGMSALIMHDKTRRAARGHSKHMTEHLFLGMPIPGPSIGGETIYGHANPEGDMPLNRMAKNGIFAQGYGENIYFGSLAGAKNDPVAAFNGWLSSPGHKANIEYRPWTHAGMGYWEGKGSYASPSVVGGFYTQKFISNPVE